jgi:hypothetical protein
MPIRYADHGSVAYNSTFASVAGLDLPALLRRHRAAAASLLAG